jgi:hypothetical protein
LCGKKHQRRLRHLIKLLEREKPRKVDLNKRLPLISRLS